MKSLRMLRHARDRCARAALAIGLALALIGSASVFAQAEQPKHTGSPGKAEAHPQAPARRIVTLAPHLTELVFSAGAGQWLMATDSYSDYPPQARHLPRIGDAFQVDYERLLALRPDLVLAWTTGMPEPAIEHIQSLGLRVERIEITRLADIPRALQRIGELAATSATAAKAAEDFTARVQGLRLRHADGAALSVFYQISESPLYTVSGKHVISELIELCGGRNIFGELGQLAPPVGIEAVIERDPQIIITADGAQGDPLSVWRRWPSLRAVREGNLFTVNADQVARSTTRIVAGAQQICAAIDSARAKAAAK